MTEIKVLTDNLDEIVANAYKHQHDIKTKKLKKIDDDQDKKLALKERYDTEVVNRFLNYAECIKDYVRTNKEIVFIDTDTLIKHKIIEVNAKNGIYNHCMIFLADPKFIQEDLRDKFISDLNYMSENYEITKNVDSLTNGEYTKFCTFTYGGLWYFSFKMSKRGVIARITKSKKDSYISIAEKLKQDLNIIRWLRGKKNAQGIR